MCVCALLKQRLVQWRCLCSSSFHFNHISSDSRKTSRVCTAKFLVGLDLESPNYSPSFKGRNLFWIFGIQPPCMDKYVTFDNGPYGLSIDVYALFRANLCQSSQFACVLTNWCLRHRTIWGLFQLFGRMTTLE